MNRQPVKIRRAGRWGPLAAVLLALIVVGPGNVRGATPAPVRAWKYIVVHHSATPGGSAEVFDASHRARGMVNGLAYHFVIDNGSGNTTDGRIEIGRAHV